MSFEYVFSGQSTQDVAPEDMSGAAFPPSQSIHSEPVLLLYLPGSQLLHTLAVSPSFLLMP